MARMSIDDMVHRDTRIDRLARLCDWSRRETRACLEDIWALCYDRVTPLLPSDDVELVALRDAVKPPSHPQGFVGAIIEAGLARPATEDDRIWRKPARGAQRSRKIRWPDQNWESRLYISGAPERICYLVEKREAGSHGGRRSAENRRNQGKHESSSATSTATSSASLAANPNPPDPVPSPAPVLREEGGSQLAAFRDVVDEAAAKRAKEPRAPKTHPNRQAVIAAFDARFKTATGAAPTWDGKTLKLADELAKKHPVAELERRMDRMFAGVVKWLTPPYTLATFATNLDSFVGAASPPAQRPAQIPLAASQRPKDNA